MRTGPSGALRFAIRSQSRSDERNLFKQHSKPVAATLPACVAAMSPGIFHMSMRLDKMHGKIKVATILFYPGSIEGTTGLRFMDLKDRDALGSLGTQKTLTLQNWKLNSKPKANCPSSSPRVRLCCNKDWETVRAGAQKLSRASAVLHELYPKLYASADSWSHSQRNQDATMSVSKVVKRTFELRGRRHRGKALVFIIDEVGQHVARSGDKIEDLRATIEEFGKVGNNLLKEHTIIAPCWIVVTFQEKLDEVPMVAPGRSLLRLRPFLASVKIRSRTV